MLVDSHCHLDRLNIDAHNNDLTAILKAAKERGVSFSLCGH